MFQGLRAEYQGLQHMRVTTDTGVALALVGEIITLALKSINLWSSRETDPKGVVKFPVGHCG